MKKTDTEKNHTQIVIDIFGHCICVTTVGIKMLDDILVLQIQLYNFFSQL